jgi:hypothetical protein
MIRLKIVLFALSNNHSLTITLTRQGLFMKFNYMEINIMFCSLDGKNIIYHLHHEDYDDTVYMFCSRSRVVVC